MKLINGKLVNFINNRKFLIILPTFLRVILTHFIYRLLSLIKMTYIFLRRYEKSLSL